jgi:hypothetical protein
MQNISLHNYQDFLLRYIDEELDLREIEALLAFVTLHPEAQEELAALELTKLEVPTISCPNKALLYKNIFPVIVEPETIVYPHKQKLFKKEKDKAPVVLLKWWAMGAAAVFLFMMVRYGILDQKAGSTVSKNSISKNKDAKESPIAVVKNNAPTNNSTINNPTLNTGSLSATKVVTDEKNMTTNAIEYAAAQNIEHQTIPTAYTVSALETVQNMPSYNGDIIDVKRTVIAEITLPSIANNEEATEIIETIDTEAASSNRSVMVGAFEIDKDKFRGLFRKVNAIIKNKENNKNEK